MGIGSSRQEPTGSLYSWGSNNSFGQLGIGQELHKNRTPRKISLPSEVTAFGDSIVSIATNVSNSYFVTSSGNVYVCGSGFSGLHGRGKGKHKHKFRFHLIETLSAQKLKIVSIAAGNSHVAVLDVHGSVYCWGSNLFGQCGIPMAETNVGNQSIVTNPKRVRMPVIKKIKCGMTSTFALTEDGVLLAFGSITDPMGQAMDPQQLMLGFNARDAPAPIELPAKVMDFDVGGIGVALLEDGSLYEWGSTRFGHEVNPPRRAAFPSSSPVVGITVAGFHCFVWTQDGKMFAKGRGPLGLSQSGTFMSTASFKECRSLASSRIVQVWTGYTVAYALSDLGDVFSWGLDFDALICALSQPTHHTGVQNIPPSLQRPRLCAKFPSSSGILTSMSISNGHALAYLVPYPKLSSVSPHLFSLLSNKQHSLQDVVMHQLCRFITSSMPSTASSSNSILDQLVDSVLWEDQFGFLQNNNNPENSESPSSSRWSTRIRAQRYSAKQSRTPRSSVTLSSSSSSSSSSSAFVIPPKPQMPSMPIHVSELPPQVAERMIDYMIQRELWDPRYLLVFQPGQIRSLTISLSDFKAPVVAKLAREFSDDSTYDDGYITQNAKLTARTESLMEELLYAIMKRHGPYLQTLRIQEVSKFSLIVDLVSEATSVRFLSLVACGQADRAPQQPMHHPNRNRPPSSMNLTDAINGIARNSSLVSFEMVESAELSPAHLRTLINECKTLLRVILSDCHAVEPAQLAEVEAFLNNRYQRLVASSSASASAPEAEAEADVLPAPAAAAAPSKPYASMRFKNVDLDDDVQEQEEEENMRDDEDEDNNEAEAEQDEEFSFTVQPRAVEEEDEEDDGNMAFDEDGHRFIDPDQSEVAIFLRSQRQRAQLRQHNIPMHHWMDDEPAPIPLAAASSSNGGEEEPSEEDMMRQLRSTYEERFGRMTVSQLSANQLQRSEEMIGSILRSQLQRREEEEDDEKQNAAASSSSAESAASSSSSSAPPPPPPPPAPPASANAKGKQPAVNRPILVDIPIPLSLRNNEEDRSPSYADLEMSLSVRHSELQREEMFDFNMPLPSSAEDEESSLSKQKGFKRLSSMIQGRPDPFLQRRYNKRSSDSLPSSPVNVSSASAAASPSSSSLRQFEADLKAKREAVLKAAAAENDIASSVLIAHAAATASVTVPAVTPLPQHEHNFRKIADTTELEWQQFVNSLCVDCGNDLMSPPMYYCPECKEPKCVICYLGLQAFDIL